MPLCPNGTEPKPTTPVAIIAGTSLITTLVGGRFPPLIPFLSALEPFLLDTPVLCNGDPVPFPEFSPEDFWLLTIGFTSTKITDAIHHAAWYAFCQCIGTATPAPPAITPPTDIPSYPPGNVLPCGSFQNTLGPDYVTTTDPVDVFGTQAKPVGIPSGATRVRAYANGLVQPHPEDYLQGYEFRLETKDQNNQTTSSWAGTLYWDNGKWIPMEFTHQFPLNTAGFWVWAHSQEAAWGPWRQGVVVSISLDFYCATPGLTQPECCPPDPTLIAKINRLQVAIDQVLASLAPPGALEQLASDPIVGEGTMFLDPGARQVNVQLGELGPGTKIVTYAHPDRVMRAGTVRFGNDFGWQRRQHVDSSDCLFPVPLDATVVSWSLSPGTSGVLLQLGAAG